MFTVATGLLMMTPPLTPLRLTVKVLMPVKTAEEMIGIETVFGVLSPSAHEIAPLCVV